MTTIKDISLATGLASTTVAEILRHKPGYKAETRTRVLEAAQQLNYRPSYLSKALAGGRSMSIAVLYWGLHIPTSLLATEAVCHSASAHRYLPYMVSIRNTDGSGTQPRNVQEALDRRVDGVIVHMTHPFPPEVVEMLAAKGTPVVYLDWAPPHTPAHVKIDRDAGFRALARHLAALGHRHAFVTRSASDLTHPQFKVHRYQRSLAQAGIQAILDDRYILSSDKSAPDATYDMVRRLAGSDDRPSVLLVGNDSCALAAVAALTDAGLRVPQDVSVVGFDDDPEARHCRPALTTIHQPQREAGRAAFEMLLQLMNDPQALVEPRSLACELIVRNSTGPVAAR